MDGLCRGVEEGRRTRSNVRVSSSIVSQEEIKNVSVRAVRILESITTDVHSTPNQIREGPDDGFK